MESLSPKKICLLYAGGISTDANFNETALNTWVSNFFELQIMAQVNAKFVFSGTGLEASWDLAKKLGQAIQENYEKYDGFVITHGADNILYTSSLLSFMLQKLGKPVIFVRFNPREDKQKLLLGSEYKILSIKASLINAVQIATMDIAEVGLVIDNFVHRAVLVKDEQKNSLIAQIQFGIHPAAKTKKRSSLPPRFNFNYESRIKIIEIYPGMRLDFSDKNYTGIFIKGLQEQTIPSAWHLPVDVPVCVYSGIYEKLENNIIFCRGLTEEAAMAKFIWCLGQTKDIPEIFKLMADNLCGEY